MVRPFHFFFNHETAINNHFQKEINIQNANLKAIQEFDNMVTVLQDNGIQVNVLQDTATPQTPDSIFPNNWVSFHSKNTICLYPMFAENRRQERKKTALEFINQILPNHNTIDFTNFEKQNLFMEGTGSMVLDRLNNISYASVSVRMDELVLKKWCAQFNYQFEIFNATDENNRPIYHTNVLMCMGDQFVVICLETIKNKTEKESLLKRFKETNKEIIEITINQMNQFAGNMLQLFNNTQSFLVMSQTAFNALDSNQINQLNKFTKILPIPIPTIEQLGGGSVRCMIAEMYK